MGAVLAAEPTPGLREYLCAFETDDGERSWLVVDDDGAPVLERRDIRDVVAITALCEIAEESAVGGDLDELLSQLVALRLTENPEGIDEAEEAVRALQHDDRDAAAPRHACAARRDRRRDAAARAGARPRGAVAVHGRPQGRPGDGRRAAEGGRGQLPRASRS